MPKYGWCKFCTKRIGHRQFRELNAQGQCAECERKFPQPISAKSKQPRAETKSKQPRAETRKSRANTNPINIEEEQQLLGWLKQQPYQKIMWVKIAASALGWDIQKTVLVGRRLRNKGLWSFPQKSRKQLEKFIIQALSSPKSAYILAEEIPVARAWISQILRDLVKEGKVKVNKSSRRNQPDIYEINETANY